MYARTLIAAGVLALLLAACAPRRPAPVPAPPPAQPTPPPAAAPAPAVTWEDAPISPGDWTFAAGGSVGTAAFGTPGAPVFSVRCEASGSVSLERARVPDAARAMTIRTTYGERRLPAVARNAGTVTATIAASDPLLDEIAFSRGRFAVEADGAPRLILPSWPEPARVVEDCRG